jgi:hypothetical protein
MNARPIRASLQECLRVDEDGTDKVGSFERSISGDSGIINHNFGYLNCFFGPSQFSGDDGSVICGLDVWVNPYNQVLLL